MRAWRSMFSAAVLIGALSFGVAPAHADADVIVRPGDALYSVNAEGKKVVCTAGLVGRVGADDMVVTAGHCFRPGENAYIERDDERVLIGTVYSSHNEPWVLDPDDAGSKQDMSGYTAIVLNSHAQPGITTDFGKIAASTTEISQGEQLCHIGVKTMYTCGDVVSVGDKRVDVDAKADKGDSGGPVFRTHDVGDGTRVLEFVGMQVAVLGDEMVINPMSNLRRNILDDLPDWQYYAVDLPRA